MMALFTLDKRALVRFSGAEAADFLNDLITTDTEAIPAGEVRPGLLLTPQGRILYDFLISRDDDDLVLEVDADRRADFIKKMMMYRLRRPVEISPDERGVHAAIDTDQGMTDCRFSGNVTRIYGTDNNAGLTPTGNDQDWQAYRYQYGLAEGADDLPPEKALPLEARLDLNHGISFEKGCYIGQEVTARTRYRGLVKKCYLPVRMAAPINTPADITVDDRNMGQVLSISQTGDEVIGLASIRLEALQDKMTLKAGGVVLTPLFPDNLMPLPEKKA